MTQTHTPGPWCIQDGALMSLVEATPVVIMDYDEEWQGGPKNKADLALILAAPALLAALKLWVDSTEGQSHMDIVVRNGRDFAQARRVALEAIAQAEGGK